MSAIQSPTERIQVWLRPLILATSCCVIPSLVLADPAPASQGKPAEQDIRSGSTNQGNKMVLPTLAEAPAHPRPPTASSLESPSSTQKGRQDPIAPSRCLGPANVLSTAAPLNPQTAAVLLVRTSFKRTTVHVDGVPYPTRNRGGMFLTPGTNHEVVVRGDVTKRYCLRLTERETRVLVVDLSPPPRKRRFKKRVKKPEIIIY